MTTRWKFHKALLLFLLPAFLISLLGLPVLAEEAKYSLQTRVKISSLPEGIKSFRLWIPYPLEGPYQKVLHSEVYSPLPWRLEKEEKYGNKILFVEGLPTGKTFTLLLKLEIVRREDTGLKEEGNPLLYLDSNPSPPFGKLIQEIAQREAGKFLDPFKKIRALYGYVYETMSYSKEGEGWGKGDPIWACTNKRGNCTDFHSLFTALANTQGIPARFEIGLSIPQNASEGLIPGYHCWAQAFEPKRGWIPLDISESKKRGERNAFFYKLPPDRILLSMGREIILNPPQKGNPLNFFFDPYVEVDGQKMDRVRASYYFQKIF